jgi:hypothetical protein
LRRAPARRRSLFSSIRWSSSSVGAAAISFAYALAFLLGLPATIMTGWLGGVLFDWTGTYTTAILTAAAIGYLGVPPSLALPRHDRGGGTPLRAPASA